MDTAKISTSDILSHIAKEKNGLKVSYNQKTLEDFEQYRITKEKVVEDTPAIITFGESKVAAACNITNITAESKAGKTAVKNVFIAGAISKTGDIDGFKDVHIKPNPQGKSVIDFDTEQSQSDQYHNLNTVLKRARLQHTPDYYHSYNIRTLGIDEYQAFTDDICRLCNEKYGGIHLIVIDGGADYISSVNDEAEANAIIAYFTKLAVTYNCAVIIIIHLNENAGKNVDTMPRGHVGRQGIRKGYCQLHIVKTGDISTMQAIRARKAGSADTPLINFQYSKEKGYHVSVEANSIEDSKQSKKDEAAIKKALFIANKVFPPPTSLRSKDSLSEIMQVTKKSYETAKRYLKDMQGWGLVEQGDDGNYRLKRGMGHLGSNGVT